MSFRQALQAKEVPVQSLAMAYAHFSDAADYPFGIPGSYPVLRFPGGSCRNCARLMCGFSEVFYRDVIAQAGNLVIQ